MTCWSAGWRECLAVKKQQFVGANGRRRLSEDAISDLIESFVWKYSKPPILGSLSLG